MLMRLFSMLRTRLFGEHDPTEEGAPPPDLTADVGVAGDDSESTEHLAPVGIDEGSIDVDVADDPGTLDDVTADAAVAARQERAAGCILDDEGLRADLTDDEYGPLLDWALGVADRLGLATGGLDDAAADAVIDAGLQTAREILRAASAAIVAQAEGDASRRAAELAYLGQQSEVLAATLGVRDESSGAAKQFATLDAQFEGEPELSGPDLATHIAQALALSSSPPDPPDAGAETGTVPENDGPQTLQVHAEDLP